MAIQSRDLGDNRDSIIALTELGTRLADGIADTLTDVEHSLNGVLPAHDIVPHHISEFVSACHRELDATAHALEAELDRTALLDCLCVAVLLGQWNGPVNAFTSEMEMLASAQERISAPESFTRDSLQAALRALCLARRRDILRRYLAAFEQEPAKVAEDRTALHGAFITCYDWEYSLRLAEQMRRRGGVHPDLTVLITLYITVMRHRYDVLQRFRQDTGDAAFDTVLRDGTLLHLPRDLVLSERAAEVLTECALDLCVPWPLLVQALPEQLRAEAERWRELLVAPDRALTFAPLVQDGDFVLLALPHVISTNLSRLVERVFAGRPSLPYYRARGAAVEDEAMRHLSGVCPGARTMRGGTYPGPRPGELIEVDGVLVWRDVVLVLESKGGYLSERARTGDPASVTSELRRTVGDGFFQAARLVRALERDREVTLTGDRGQSLTLAANAIRRIYAVVPTADKFESLSTTLDLLWTRQILPDGAIPLIMAVQDLHLLTDLLRTPLELLGYLDYREEVLAEPGFRVGDELEVLGCYVGNTDVIGDLRKVRTEPGSALLSTNQQERFLDPWIHQVNHARVNHIPVPPPPRRHTEADRALIERFHADTGDTASATLLHQFDGAHLGVAIRLTDEATRPRRGAPIPYVIGDFGVVVVNPGEPVRAVRRLPRVREVRARTRMLVYLSPAHDGAVLRHAELGRAHVLAERTGGLVERSRLGKLDPWFDDHARRRHGAHRDITPADQENVSRLVEAGLPDTTARGVTRQGLTSQVLDLAGSDAGISLNQAADLYLTHVHQAADALGVDATDLAFSTGAARDVLRLLASGAIRPEDAVTLIRLSVGNPAVSVETLAGEGGLLTEHSTSLLDRVLAGSGHTVDELRRMNAKDRRKARNRLLGAIRRQHPTVNMNAAAAYVERLFPS
ncbi:hypothetical protein [Kibdelosporangium phytohabitans]|uniref:Uncharacterized protein n=1 Tax=Kibdelosporangium phytohabitans TaxID=860235 RepID=A0A0N9I555_9PSEU|nr:hypothetical protein [Kibdelosporangium phytohabitans]ALG09510.1 hypothetical protein AOZ06_23705 [Kibdelosporangium phytohabitans]MBE1469187.1 hypothetical protein [Kibdelosporangium phytohabitans]